MQSYPVEPLDLMQYINGKFHEPYIHEMIEVTDGFDELKLIHSITKLVHIFPILKCVYDSKNNKFIENENFTINDVLKKDEKTNKDIILTESLDMTKNLILFTLSKNTLFITISHLVCDGSSFKELLYLLCDLYNDNIKENYDYLMKRDFEELSKNIQNSKSMTFKMLISMLGGYKNKKVYESKENEDCFVIQRTLPKEIMDKIHKNAKKRHATLNDTFLTAYARALNKFNGNKKINIPCTVDLRKYATSQTGIANLTGTYNLNVKINKSENFNKTLSKINSKMSKLKSTKNDIAGPMLLVKKYNHSTLNQFLKLYGNMKTSAFTDYTNLGIIDDKKLMFNGSNVINAIGFSGVQHSPHFQIAVSSFKGATTFSTLVQCDKKSISLLNQIMDNFIQEIISFGSNTYEKEN